MHVSVAVFTMMTFWLLTRRRKTSTKQQSLGTGQQVPAGPPLSSKDQAGKLAQCLDEFESSSRKALRPRCSVPTSEFSDAIDMAVKFVRAICEGVAGFDPDVQLMQGNTGDIELQVRVRIPLYGEFPTRSRVPYSIGVGTEPGLRFRLSTRPPAGSCPFECKCHARCFGPSSNFSAGGPSWAELGVRFPNGQQRSFDGAFQAGSHSLTDIQGIRIVALPGNRVADRDVVGAAVVVVEKLKPGTTSDGALIEEAHAKGARCVIKVGGGGSLIYRVADPISIPCIALTLDDGTELLNALAQCEHRGHSTIANLTEHDRREGLKQERWGSGNSVFVHMQGLQLLTLDHQDQTLSSLVSASRPGRVATYEEYYSYFEENKNRKDELSLARSKFRRIFESVWSQLRRVGITGNPAQMGKLLALAGQRGCFNMDYIRFFPAKKRSGTSCAVLISDAHPDTGIAAFEGMNLCETQTRDLQAWGAHEAMYIATMGEFTRLIDFMAPSLWNFVKCANHEFFGWEADASKVVKLFTACTGPVGPVPSVDWQREDPTWRITDERNRLGFVTQTQGRVLWNEVGASSSTAAASRKQNGNTGFSRRRHGDKQATGDLEPTRGTASASRRFATLCNSICGSR